MNITLLPEIIHTHALKASTREFRVQIIKK